MHRLHEVENGVEVLCGSRRAVLQRLVHQRLDGLAPQPTGLGPGGSNLWFPPRRDEGLQLERFPVVEGAAVLRHPARQQVGDTLIRCSVILCGAKGGSHYRRQQQLVLRLEAPVDAPADNPAAPAMSRILGPRSPLMRTPVKRHPEVARAAGRPRHPQLPAAKRYPPRGKARGFVIRLTTRRKEPSVGAPG